MEHLQTVKDFFLEHVADRKKSILLGIYFCALFVIPSAIVCFMCAKTANTGFNIVLTALINLGYTGGAWRLVKFSKSPIGVGFLIGASLILSLLNLMTSIYWGELSNCKVEDGTHGIQHFSCSTPAAYGAVSAFAALLFITQLYLTVAITLWRSDLIDAPDAGSATGSTGTGLGLANGQYDGLPASNNL